ncbi:MAG: GPR endopeptidase [Bacilli bacterium]|nr:GPR endopeptidase [Bacilli bacterium]
MQNKKISNKEIRTDLIIEQKLMKDAYIQEERKEDIIITTSKINSNYYTTISFRDITDKDNFNSVLKILVNELKKYLKVTKTDTILVIGLGNSNSTPDSLGPLVVNHVLVTRYLFILGNVESGYSNVCSFKPDVMGNTGIETTEIINCIIKESNATKVIIIDSLKASNLKRLTKTIQITNKGISPGSGLNSKYKEISKKTTGAEIIAIGVPTVVDIKTISKKEKNLIVTPTDIDFIIEKLSILIGEAINISLHKNYIRQNNNN